MELTLQDCVSSWVVDANHRHISKLKIEKFLWGVGPSVSIHRRHYVFHPWIVHCSLLRFCHSHQKGRRKDERKPQSECKTHLIIFCYQNIPIVLANQFQYQLNIYFHFCVSDYPNWLIFKWCTNIYEWTHKIRFIL